MTKTDTSREAVERLIENIPGVKSAKEVWSLQDAVSETLSALLTERDALQARAERFKNRGDNHWETLRSIRAIARETGDLERIIQWVNDAGSGYTETADTTLSQEMDRRFAAEAGLTELEQIANDEARHAHRDLIQQLTERAERAEAGLRYYRDQMCEGFCTDLKSQSEYGESMDFHCAGCKARATLAQLDAEPAMRCAECDCDNPPHGCNWIAPGPLAEPAGVSEPAGVRVKPLEWKDNKASTPFGDYSIHQTPDGYEVIDPEGEEIVHVGFNSDPIRSAYRLAQEFAQADYEQRILVALEPGQTKREVWEQCKEAAAECIERKNTNNVGMVHPVAASDAAAIRAMPYPGDSQ